MGTRHLIFVISDGITRVAQYGQWDGYMDGAGLDILNFLKSHSLSEIKNAMAKTRLITKEEWTAAMNEIKFDPNRDFLTRTEFEAWDERYPLFHRDLGPDILGKIMEYSSEGKPIVLEDNSNLSKDSLAIEWGYVIDFDKNTFEVYKGFNRQALALEERFHADMPEGTVYFPIRHLVSFPLTDLPNEEEFLCHSTDT